MPTARPRNRDIASSPRPSNSVSCNRTEPRTLACSGNSPITAIAETDFPEPDSPTMATTSPGSMR